MRDSRARSWPLNAAGNRGRYAGGTLSDPTGAEYRLARRCEKSRHRGKTSRVEAHPTDWCIFSESQRDKLVQKAVKGDKLQKGKRGCRRVVASCRTGNRHFAIRRADPTNRCFVVIGAGGGGIPVVRTEAGDYQSVDAVIDKDLLSLRCWPV